MAGPQILSSIIFVTTKKPLRTSLAYLSGILLALITGVILWFLIFNNLLTGTQLASGSSGDSGLKPVQLALIGLLIYLSITTFINREKSEQPKWLKNLGTMKPLKAFGLGFVLIMFFPSDFIILMTVGATLAQENQNLSASLPFIIATFAIASLPTTIYILFRKKMLLIMPKVRGWMEDNSWIVSIFVYILFVFLIL